MDPGVHPSVPWRIETDPGQDYLVSLIDAQSQAAVLTVYLRGGVPFRGLAPEGAFKLVYSSGTSWLGLSRGFGTGSRTISSPQIYRIRTGPDDSWTWSLRLHPNSSEGSPVAPLDPPSDPSAPPTPEPPSGQPAGGYDDSR